MHEESLAITGRIKKSTEKSNLIERALVESEKAAVAAGQSLAVIRPTDVGLSWVRLSKSQIERDRQKFEQEAAQLSMIEEEISAYEPCPYKFTLKYRDASGDHKKTCADWETSAAFFKLRRKMDELDVLEHLRQTYCEHYVSKGLVLALGNMKKRPQTWQLLGVFPVERPLQPDLFAV